MITLGEPTLMPGRFIKEAEAREKSADVESTFRLWG